MLNIQVSILRLVVILLAGFSFHAHAQETAIKVNAFNYVSAKTAIQFDKYLARAGGEMNTFFHARNVASIDNKSSRRLNRDTLYSIAIVDISKGASIYLPDAGDRYLSVQVVNEDGFTNKIFHGAGEHKLRIAELDTPFVWMLVRTLVFESIEGDLDIAHALQDSMSIKSNSNQMYSHPAYDQESFDTITKLIVKLGSGLTDNSKAAGTKEQVDPIKQLILSAYGFGTLPETESFLTTVEPDLPADNAYSLTVKDVPVDGFWSLAMYDKNGYFNENEYHSYGFGDRTAKKNTDGSITLNFGGDPSSVNFIPLSEGWNYVVRMYRPRAEVIDRTWTFPKVKEVKKQ
jgi:hypothetical protein